MFNFKFNIKLIKILLILVIVAFFTPFFSVSCTSNDPGVNFSGFDLSVGKTVGDNWHSGNLLGLILIIPAVGLLILAFVIREKNNICKMIFFIAPVFNIFAGFIIKRAFEAAVLNKIYGEITDIPQFNLNPETLGLNIIFGVKFGFVLYIFLNAVIFALSAVNYFAGIASETPSPTLPPAPTEFSSRPDA